MPRIRTPADVRSRHSPSSRPALPATASTDLPHAPGGPRCRATPATSSSSRSMPHYTLTRDRRPARGAGCRGDRRRRLPVVRSEPRHHPLDPRLLRRRLPRHHGARRHRRERRRRLLRGAERRRVHDPAARRRHLRARARRRTSSTTRRSTRSATSPTPATTSSTGTSTAPGGTSRSATVGAEVHIGTDLAPALTGQNACYEGADGLEHPVLGGRHRDRSGATRR